MTLQRTAHGVCLLLSAGRERSQRTQRFLFAVLVVLRGRFPPLVPRLRVGTPCCSTVSRPSYRPAPLAQRAPAPGAMHAMSKLEIQHLVDQLTRPHRPPFRFFPRSASPRSFRGYAQTATGPAASPEKSNYARSYYQRPVRSPQRRISATHCREGRSDEPHRRNRRRTMKTRRSNAQFIGSGRADRRASLVPILRAGTHLSLRSLWSFAADARLSPPPATCKTRTAWL